jgi:signal peptidase I
MITFLLRAFTFEPFNAPSASMNPTIQANSVLFAQKWGYGNYGSYGINLFRTAISAPLQRGDILVFEVPDKRKISYVKRLIGLPGDHIEYRNKRLIINGQAIETQIIKGNETNNGTEDTTQLEIHEEHLTTGTYRVKVNPNLPPLYLSEISSFKNSEHCQFNDSGFICTVPDDHYFMMGDNRDNSMDSRYWGFLPADHIVGKVVNIFR